MQINYSIIIPHKNRPDLLKRCLESIPSRDDIEVIIIDDNSDPDKVNLLSFPGNESKNTQIHFLKQGKGAGYARNFGLNKAIGEWILFADSDDFFSKNFIDIIDNYKESKHDLIYFGRIKIIKKKDDHFLICPKNNRLMEGAINKGKIDKFKYSILAPWGKMIKRSLIIDNNILFDETIVANDKMFSLKTAHLAKSVFFDKEIAYIYMSEDGILTKIDTPESHFERFKVYLNINNYLNSIGQKKYKV
ncbi:MAG: glycosyltransferase family 2 protein, partial [Treponema sp.]|nr:glycosyltransferase family 2 protein [Treponema sp.]